MSSPDRQGILAAGNFIIDHVKMISEYPAPEMLATIHSQSSSNGGGPYNLLKDLAKMRAPFPLHALGLIGDDDLGRWILEDLRKSGIDASLMKQTASAATSYTDAMTVAEGGQRTFFHHRGANAVFGEEHCPLERSSARVFYLGYLLLMDTMDRLEADGSTQAGRVLAKAKQLGFATAIDFVSTKLPNTPAIARASFPHVDLLLVNEIEVGLILGRELASADWPAAEAAAAQLFDLGIRERVVIHCKEGGLVVTRDGQAFRQGSVKMPPGRVKGATGAGDAFAAGMLLGWHEGWEIPRCLRLAVCAAAASLEDATPSESLRPVEDCLALGEEFGYWD